MIGDSTDGCRSEGTRRRMKSKGKAGDGLDKRQLRSSRNAKDKKNRNKLLQEGKMKKTKQNEKEGNKEKKEKEEEEKKRRNLPILLLFFLAVSNFCTNVDFPDPNLPIRQIYHKHKNTVGKKERGG